jgi:Protein of unknown function (DUF2442)
MRKESNAHENSPVDLVEEIAPRSPWRVTNVEALPEFRLRVAFVDGSTGLVDMARLVHSPTAGVFAALLDPCLFAQVRIEYGAVSWPGELDLAPDAMHAAIREHGVWSI